MCSLVVVSPSRVYAPLSETHFVSPTLLSSALLWTPSKTNLTFPLFFSQLLCLQNSSSRFPDSCFQIAHLNIKYHLVAGAKSKKKKKKTVNEDSTAVSQSSKRCSPSFAKCQQDLLSECMQNGRVSSTYLLQCACSSALFSNQPILTIKARHAEQ